MRLLEELVKRESWLVLALCCLLLPMQVTQCSAPPPVPPEGETKWGLATRHDNVSLLSTIGGSSESPAWSPDGTLIAFQHTESRMHQGDSMSPRDIYVVNSDGTGERLLTPGVGERGFSCKYPSWAPDSRRLVCACDTSGDYDLYLLDVASGDLIRLTDYSDDEVHPAWSPDGRLIAFSWLNSTGSGIYTVTSEGNDLRRLTTGARDTEPAWSPDGRKISFSSSGSSYRDVMCIIGADSSASVCYEGVQCGTSTWSPDGSTIACGSGPSIVAIEVADERTTVLLDEEYGYMSGLSWSPDGSRLVLTYGRQFLTANDLYVLRIEP